MNNNIEYKVTMNGKEINTENLKKRHTYKRNIKRFTFSRHATYVLTADFEDDADVIEKLKQQSNYSNYLKNLVRADIEKATK